MCIEYHRCNKNTFCVLATQLWQLSVEISWISAPVAEHWGCRYVRCNYWKLVPGRPVWYLMHNVSGGYLMHSCSGVQHRIHIRINRHTRFICTKSFSMHILAFWQLHKSGNCLGNALPPDKQWDRHRHTCTGTHAHVTLPAMLQVSC